MKGEREVAGVRCSEVLERLSDYFDGALDAPVRTQLEQHVQACDHCARFGGVFAAALGALRERRGTPPLNRGLSERLRVALDRSTLGRGPDLAQA